MQEHTTHFWTHLVVVCSLEQEGDAAVHRGQILSSVCHSLDLWCFQANWNMRRNTRLNHDDVSDLQVIALERGPSSGFLNF